MTSPRFAGLRRPQAWLLYPYTNDSPADRHGLVLWDVWMAGASAVGSGLWDEYGALPVVSGWGQICSTSASGIVAAVTAIGPAVILVMSDGSSAR